MIKDLEVGHDPGASRWARSASTRVTDGQMEKKKTDGGRSDTERRQDATLLASRWRKGPHAQGCGCSAGGGKSEELCPAAADTAVRGN